MDYKQIIGNNTLVICNNEIKNKILDFLNSTNELFSIKFMTMNELIKSLFFDYDKKTIKYLMDKYKFPVDVSKVYIKNMYYVQDMEYSSSKLNKLVSLKHELDDNKLLIKDSLFKDFLANKRIIICQRNISSFDKYIIDILKTITNVDIYQFEYDVYEHKVYEFKTIDDEIEYVAYSICELIDKGIDINKIKISNIDNDYINSIKRIFGFYNIPINLPDNSYLIGTKICRDFIDNLDSDINKTIDAISKYSDTDIYNQIINICNEYSFCSDYLEIKDLLMYDLTNTKVKQHRLVNAVEIIDYKDIIEDEYVFLMNFNLKTMPKVYKDEDYITDNIKPSYLDSTVKKNKDEKEVTIKCIDSIKNLVITYKLVTPTGEFYPSNLVERYTVEKPGINIYKSYSKINDQLKLASYLDKLVKYGSKDSKLNALKYNYDIPYMTYDNKYKKIDINDLYELIDNKITLSYSTLEQFYECPFKYYLSNILKLNIYEDNFSAVLGTVFHHILEVGIKKEINIDEEVTSILQSEYKDRVFSKNETFFLESAKKDMQFVLDTIKMQMSFCKLTGVLTEKNVFVSKDNKIKVIFMGKIDKILYREDEEQTILALIDYKTGSNVDIDLGYMSYGVGLQLPIYLYLASNLDFKNIKIAGIYLQKVMPDLDKADDVEKKGRMEKLKLEGYSNSDQNIVKELDFNYESSSVIKGLKITNSGRFDSRSKILSNDEFDSLIKLANEKIEDAIIKIEDAEYDIKPIKKEKEDGIKGCKYCNYKDICFRTNDDVVTISKDSDLDFLGGGDNE